MKKIQTTLLVGLMFCALALVGCKDPVNNTTTPDDGVPAIDYTSHTDYSVMVTNNTSFNLVAFKGSPRKSNLLGGIPANQTNHKLGKVASLFPTSQDFMLFIVKEDDYRANYENLSALDNTPFASIYAYYNTNSANLMSYEISSLSGGNGEIVVHNTSNMNIELRLEGPKGATLGYVGDGMARTTFKVQADNQEYYIFPVFRKFNSTTNEIMTVFPTWTSGNHAGQPVYEYFELNATDKTKNLYSTNWIGAEMELNPGYAYLQVQNGSSSGVNFLDGGVAQTTSTGGKIINSNRTMTFQIAMPKISGGATDAVYGNQYSATDNSYAIGLPTDPYYIPAYTYKAGYIYGITCTGTQGDLTLSEITIVGRYDFVNNKIVPVED